MNYYGSSFWAPTDLAHYGVIGMKWGVRRYQNKDGSLTAAGKKHYGTSGLNDKTAKKLERNIKIDSLKYVGSTKHIRPIEMKQRYKASSEITKSAFDIVKQSEELSKIISELKKCEKKENDAYEAWSKDKELQKQTINDYIKAKGKEEYADYYLNLEGGDAVTNVWSYYKNNTPELKANDFRAYDLSAGFKDKSKKVFDLALGEYGSTKLASIKWGDKHPTISDYLTNKANMYMYDYVLLGDYAFK